MARSSATPDDSNNDNVCSPIISVGINRPPPSRPSRIYPECRDHETGVTHDWNGTLRTGNLVRSDLLTQYMAFVREEQKKAGVKVSQAPALLRSHLVAIIAHMAFRIRCTHDPYDRIVLARDIALFTLAFSTTKRGDELSRTATQRMLRLSNECGFLFNFQWAKAMRDGAGHLMTVEYDTKRMTACPVREVEQYIAVLEPVLRLQ